MSEYAFIEYCVEWHFMRMQFLREMREHEPRFDAEHAPPDDIDDTKYVRPRGWVS